MSTTPVNPVESTGEFVMSWGPDGPTITAPAIPKPDPTRKPKRRPRRCISSAAGNTQNMMPRCCSVIGSVARSRFG